MKKALSILFVLMFLCSVAFAEAAMEPVNAMFQIIPYYDSSVGLYYAEVINTGDTLICLDAERSRVELMDAEGNVLISEEIYSTSPAALAPGETGYVIPFHMYLDDVDVSALTDYAIHLYAEEAVYYDPTSYLNAEGISAEIRTEPNSWGDEETSIFITFTNTTEDVLYDFNFAVGIYDAAGTLIYTCEPSAYDVGVPAGQSIIVRESLDEMITSYWAENGIVPASVKAIGYQN